MASRKITRFLGVAPKVSPELLPETASQTCVNAKLYSGDLIPYRSSASVDTTGRGTLVQTIYPLYDGDTTKWLSWTTDVDVAVASSTNDNSQRIYFSGDGVPKVTNYELAVSGGQPWPASNGWYELGLDIPTAVPVATPATISAVAISNVSRDANNVATYTTSSAHGFRTGMYVTVSGFSVIEDTYTSVAATDTITVAVSDPVFSVGGTVSLTFTSGDAASAVGFSTYKIKAASASEFKVRQPNITASSGDVDIDMTALNVQGAYITVVDSTSFTAFSSGASMGEVSGTFSTIYGSGIEVELAGQEVGRSYVYTWITGWAEESVPSDPSETVYVKEGQSVTISNLPTAAPAGDNFIRGIRLYRSVTSTTGSSYFRLRTIWFPNDIVTASRTSNVATVTTEFPHKLAEGDLIKIDNMEFGTGVDTSFDVTDVEVASVVDDNTFTYAATGSDKAETAVVAGTLYYDIAEFDSGDSRYYEGSTFVDNYDVGGLSATLTSLYADKPDEDMVGIRAIKNNIMVGFFANELCFSEPAKPWSWPQRYRITFPYNIVAVEPTAGAILVLTDKYPYVVTGSNPENMTPARADSIMPCLSKRSVVNMGYGVVYATYGGLAMYSPASGPEIVSEFVHYYDTWETYVDPSEIVATFYDGKYFGSHSGGSFLFERDQEVGGFLVTTPIKFNSTYYDTSTGSLFYTNSTTDGVVYEWDAVGQPFMSMEWKSKVFVDQQYTNIGAVRIVADFAGDPSNSLAVIAFNDGVPALNSTVWGYITQLGTLGGPTDYTDPDSSTWVVNPGSWNEIMFNGDNHTTYTLSTAGLGTATFSVWANKELKFSEVITSDAIFRLPAGYRSDTFEVSISGSLRVRAIHIGETPSGLRSV